MCGHSRQGCWQGDGRAECAPRMVVSCEQLPAMTLCPAQERPWRSRVDDHSPVASRWPVFRSRLAATGAGSGVGLSVADAGEKLTSLVSPHLRQCVFDLRLYLKYLIFRFYDLQMIIYHYILSKGGEGPITGVIGFLISSRGAKSPGFDSLPLRLCSCPAVYSCGFII